MAAFTVTTRKQRVYNFNDDRNISMCIYKISNKKNGKSYIGQSTGKVAIRWRNHCGKKTSAINKAIKKYGISEFDFSVIQTCKNIDELNEYEQYYVDYFNTISPNGYNLHTGGDNHIASEESRIKMSNAACSRWGVEKSKAKIASELTSEEKNVQKLERIKKMIQSKKGKPSGRKGMKFSDEWVSNISKSKIGNKHRNTKIVRDDGVIFSSVINAADSINAKPGSVTAVLRGTRKKIYGYSFEYLNKKGGILSQHLQ